MSKYILMREIIFLKKYQEKWKKLEEILSQPGKKNPDQLSDLFIQLTDDLSYSRTYYPDSNTTKYLNSLSAQLHQEIYKNKKENTSRFIAFWKYEVPETMARHMNILLLSFIIFIISLGLGWLSSSSDSTFSRLILGESYVNMTEQNIKNGKPMDVYGSMEEGGMFLYITTNNIFVSFLFFVLGLSFGIGSISKLISTGVMVGTFLQMFYAHSMLSDAMIAIWMHGTIEISVAIIAGAAGIVLGKSIAFPGTYSRIESIKSGAKDGLKMVIGLVPCFILAGFIESFITRHYNYNIVLSMSVILCSLAFIISYFILYPLYLGKKLNIIHTKKTDDIKNSKNLLIFGISTMCFGAIIMISGFEKLFPKYLFYLIISAISIGGFLFYNYVNSTFLKKNQTHEPD